ncbi:PAS domain-containing protein [Calderihabitans maritimus]|uniref:PAS domain-containing protein n=1 Tax=Calderihabitans maritimus TaxID=1246530 RepID=A0A1Z5HUV8_9FIRM|nr:PAS domain-containing protein [Calderihabitans maritimus]GAW93115.1 hypothetical protein KKC1_22560 [Calderihabitans maritimus]
MTIDDLGASFQTDSYREDLEKLRNLLQKVKGQLAEDPILVELLEEITDRLEKYVSHMEFDKDILLNILKNSPWGIFICDQAGRLTFANEAFGRMLQVNPARLLHYDLNKLGKEFFPEHQYLWTNVNAKVPTTEVSANTARGKLTLEVCALPLQAEKEVQGMVWFCSNLERWEDLAQFKRQATFLLESLQLGIIIIDRQEIVRYVNEEYCRMVGFPKGWVLGRPITAVKNKVFKEITPSVILETLHKGTSYFEEEVEVVFNDGRRGKYSVNSAQLKDEYGEVSGALLVIRDLEQEAIFRKNENEQGP